MITATVNGIEVKLPAGSSVLDACNYAGVYVPTLCNHPDIPPAGKCGVCVVKINGSSYNLSCSTKLQEGMKIVTNTPDVKDKALQALNKFNDMNMMPQSPEIEDVFKYFNQKNPVRGRKKEKTNSVQFDPKQCINCGRCVRQCAEGQQVGALDEDSHLLTENECIGCGQCTTVCPTQALTERHSFQRIISALAQGKILVLQTAPAVRVAVGEEFGDPVGTVVTGKIVSAARQMGFKYVFDTNFGADLTILEEGTELIDRLTNGGVLPMFTSCCPAWINFAEKMHPELIPHISSAKSPHMMLGAIIKTFFAEKNNFKKEDIYVVSLMPCTAKKDEIEREQLKGDVDCVITSREFAHMIREYEIEWENLPDGQFDSLLGESTGAAALFGVTGGVMEAALRFAHEELTKEKLGKVEYTKWRGFDGIKTATTCIAGAELKIAVCNGIANARKFIEDGTYKQYTFIEVMACPMGCISGGGQPKLRTRQMAKRRADAIYEIDHQAKNKQTSNDNNELKDLYKQYLGAPGSHLPHQLLHTHYQQQTTALLEMKKKMEDAPIIAYGSASGTAQKYAKTISNYIGGLPIALNNLTIQKIIKKGFCVLVCSTFGDGEFPSNAQKFYDELVATNEDLNGVKFAVCALGSQTYPKFCACGHALEKAMISKGAQRILPTVEIDSSSSDKGEGVFEKWAPELVTSLGFKMPDIIITPQYTFNVVKDPEDPIHTKPEKPLGFDFGLFLSSTVLTPEGYVPEMHRYTVKLPKGMTYEAGDHVAILPENNLEIVKAVLKEMRLDGNDILEVSTTVEEGMTFIPSRVTVQQLFQQYLDLNGTPTRNLIRAFKQAAQDDHAKDIYSRLLDFQHPHKYNDLIKDTNVGEFIMEYGGCYGMPSLDILVTAIPHIKPRLYSIASAPEGSSGTIDLIITDNYFGQNRSGLCTSFLKKYGITHIPIHTQKGYFNYPKQQTTPVLMAALGCGIAPMLSLLQHRESLEGSIGNAGLFFGCRHKNKYPILDSILNNYIDLGALQDLYVAYSREGTTKTYITSLMRTNPDIVWEYWQNPKCEFFYCGPARGIPDELHDILVEVTMMKASMTRDDAEQFYQQHPIHIEAF